MARKSELRETVKIFYEAGVLKRIPRSGWFLAGIKNPETIAEHLFRSALIGYFLAKMEKADENKVMKMCLTHDLAEVRIGERNKVNARYIDSKQAELKAFQDIFKKIDNKEFVNLFKELYDKRTKEAVVAKDADMLEVIIQAREYVSAGESDSLNIWIRNEEKRLKTKSAKRLAKTIGRTKFNEWWKGLKKFSG